MKSNVLLIGSGPSTLASFLRLMQQDNLDITLVDGGNLSSHTISQKCIFSNSDFETGNRISFKDTSNIDHDFSYESKNSFFPKPSMVHGGYSNYWGGTVFPDFQNLFEYEDLATWGTELDKLEKMYDEISKVLNLHSNSHSENYPKGIVSGLPISKREKKIYKKLNNLHKKKATKYFVDYSCISLGKEIGNSICNECGGFSWACKEDTIWSSKALLKKYIDSGRIKYLENYKVQSISQEEDFNLSVKLKNTDNREENIIFHKVFLGAGPVGTGKIILNSCKEIKCLELKTSDLLSIPFLSIYGNEGEEKRHTLADLFFVYKNKKKVFFGQIYGYTENILKLSKDSVPLANKLSKYFNFLLERTGGMYFYLDHKVSTTLIMSEKNDQIILSKGRSGSLFNTLKIRLYIYSVFLFNGIFLIPLIGKKYKYGNSNHIGSQFPLEEKDNPLKSDKYGSIKYFKNLHIIDSSVLPFIPSGPITFTVMSNASRITDEVYS